MNSKYYVLGMNRFEKGWAFCEEEDDALCSFDVREKCPLCGRFVGLAIWLPPYEIKLSSKKLGDFMFGTTRYLIVSERFKREYEDSGFSGIKEFHKIDQIRFRKEIIDAVYYWAIPRRVDVRPEPIEADFYPMDTEYCDVCSKVGGNIYSNVRGLKMNMRNLKNTPDVFLTYTDGDIVYCTEEFVNFCKEKEFRNIETHIKLFEEYKSWNQPED